MKIYTIEVGDPYEGFFPIFASNSKEYVEGVVNRHNSLASVMRKARDTYILDVQDGYEDVGFYKYEKIKERLFKDMISKTYCEDEIIVGELEYYEVHCINGT